MKGKYETSPELEQWKLLMEKDDIDLTLLRYLIGKKGSVDVAWAAFEKSMAWRAEFTPNGVGSAVVDIDDDKFGESCPYDKEVMKYSAELSFNGTCIKGNPLVYYLSGRMDVLGLIKAITAEQYHQRTAYSLIATFRKVNQLSREHNRFMGVCLIYCSKNATLTHLKFLPYFKFFADDLQLNCPEMLSDCYVVNTPWFFNMAFGIIKPWLDKRTLDKLHILGTTEERLVEYVERKFIPVALGGEDASPRLVIPDPLQGLSILDVGAGKKHEIEVRCPANENASSISWKWQPVGKDVGFQVVFVADDESNEELNVVDYARVSATGEVHQGSYMSPRGKSGTLKFVWDNSFSYWTGKQVMQWIGDFEEIQSQS